MEKKCCKKEISEIISYIFEKENIKMSKEEIQKMVNNYIDKMSEMEATTADFPYSN